jgi:thymidylate synthase (FAD)
MLKNIHHFKVPVLDKGYVEIQDMMGDDMAIINAARTSFLGESKDPEKDKKLLFYLMENHHDSPFEMVEFRFRVHCPIITARQWMRHRTFSFSEVSRRYTEEEIEFYIPDVWRMQSANNKQASDGVVEDEISSSYTSKLKYTCSIAYEYYENAIADGISREMARMFLPVNLYTTFVAKVDARNLMHFLQLRMDEHAQYEIRVYADAIYENFFKPALPWTAEAFEKFVLTK